ncbi:hypothetical protein PTSG_04339 [Salpingoeca rosetta]|uniref:Uncharacterized protein n=1 Tax=Salpingoeca rosetta (strain ATCC 50818 / BSB-021) TaxID=946362 RepID=F2U896_SALR5|nr:uncharacterized protein PTSG_04339 [Salpingoeca rosetta]EGD72604.1 hypothetical protein PTSG_04339 [Salpingoeca rosetta]|eukprot:XP_004994427.1 hypothetical protein PTSG_04339 [Salpingoeca rosetta]
MSGRGSRGAGRKSTNPLAAKASSRSSKATSSSRRSRKTEEGRGDEDRRSRRSRTHRDAEGEAAEEERSNGRHKERRHRERSGRDRGDREHKRSSRSRDHRGDREADDGDDEDRRRERRKHKSASSSSKHRDSGDRRDRDRDKDRERRRRKDREGGHGGDEDDSERRRRRRDKERRHRDRAGAEDHEERDDGERRRRHRSRDARDDANRRSRHDSAHSSSRHHRSRSGRLRAEGPTKEGRGGSSRVSSAVHGEEDAREARARRPSNSAHAGDTATAQRLQQQQQQQQQHDTEEEGHSGDSGGDSDGRDERVAMESSRGAAEMVKAAQAISREEQAKQAREARLRAMLEEAEQDAAQQQGDTTSAGQDEQGADGDGKGDGGGDDGGDDEYNYEDDEFEDYEYDDDFEDEDDEDDEEEGEEEEEEGEQGGSDKGWDAVNRSRRVRDSDSDLRSLDGAAAPNDSNTRLYSPGQPRLSGDDDEMVEVLDALRRENLRTRQGARGSRRPINGSGLEGTSGAGKFELGSAAGDNDDYEGEDVRVKKMDFSRAAKRAKGTVAGSRAMRRFKALSSMVQLDFVSFNLFELAPVSVYELYIRSFGNDSYTQTATQCAPEIGDQGVQTEEVETQECWTQYPPSDLKGFGRPLTKEEQQESKHALKRETTTSEYESFVLRMGRLCAAVLDEEAAIRRLEQGDGADATSVSGLSSSSTHMAAAAPIFAGAVHERVCVCDCVCVYERRAITCDALCRRANTCDALCRRAITCDALCRRANTCDALCRRANTCDALCRRANTCDALCRRAITCDALCRRAITCDALCRRDRFSRINIASPLPCADVNASVSTTGRHVTSAVSSASNPQMLATVYSPAPIKRGGPATRMYSLGLVALWDVASPSAPRRVLACEGQPTSCCFAGHDGNLLVAGTQHGGVVVWDLTDTNAQVSTDATQPLFLPAFTSDGASDGPVHEDSVIAVLPIASATGTGAMQVVTADSSGRIITWTSALVSNPSNSGSLDDLGLRPGASVKMNKSAVLDAFNEHDDLVATCLVVHPLKPGHLFVGTNSACIVHCTRHGRKPAPRRLQLGASLPGTCTDLAISPADNDHLLSAFDSGYVCIHKLRSGLPMRRWSVEAPPNSIFWSNARAAVFYVLCGSTLHIWDC